MNQGISVWWLRNDLRVHDNETLIAAIRTGKPVLAVFCLCPRLRGLDRFGFSKTGPARLRFLLQSLEDLRQKLAKLGIGFLLSYGSPAETIEGLSAETAISWVGRQREWGTEELAEDDKVDRLCRKLGAKSFRADGFPLVHPQELPFASESAPDLFTTFRKQAESRLVVRDCLPAPKPSAAPWRGPNHPLPSFEELQAKCESPRLKLATSATNPTGKDRFTGGETAALARLKHYLWDQDRLRVYKETRNGMLLEDDSSKFSPWLALGCLSPRQIYWEVKRYERERVSNDSTYGLIFELLWRDFFLFQIRKWKESFFKVGGIHRISVPWTQDDDLLNAWLKGETGYPLIDAALRELDATGYTSNRARQNLASFFTKNLGLDWRLGAATFESALVDYESAANWGNWMYQAGVGHDGREFRLFNLERQATQYDPKAEFAAYWIPELRSVPVAQRYNPPASVREKVGYPQPVVPFDLSAKENRQRYERAAGVGASGGSERSHDRHDSHARNRRRR